METLLVTLIVGIAAAYLVRIFYKSLRNGGGCNSGCSSCDMDTACDNTPKNDS